MGNTPNSIISENQKLQLATLEQSNNDIGFRDTYQALIEGLKTRSLDMSVDDFNLFMKLFAILKDKSYPSIKI